MDEESEDDLWSAEGEERLRRINRTAGLFGGGVAGTIFFFAGWFLHGVLSFPLWLVLGGGTFIALIAMPNVRNAKYAVPVQLIVFWVLVLVVLGD